MVRCTTKFASSDTYREQPAFSHQYTSFYYTRLAQLKPHIAIPPAWSSSAKPVSRVLDIEQNQFCWVAGTITREAAGKPNIMEDLKKMYHGQAPQTPAKYCTPNDKFFLEDEYGRIEIVGTLPAGDLLVTGIVVALLGSQNQLGEFEVADIAYPSRAPQPSRMSASRKGKIAFVSGLLLDDVASEPFGVQMLSEYLAENSDISRLIICGESLSAQPDYLVGARMMRPVTALTSLEELDRLLSSLAMILPVHLMPGETDPTTIAFPQTAMHPAILQKSRSLLKSQALTLETNPQKFDIDGTSILGNSGQPVKDLRRYTNENDEKLLKIEEEKQTNDYEGTSLDLQLLYKTLQWRHMAPTAPDTLSSYPYVMEDPLVISELPHVYFTGNCSEFSTAVKDNVRLLGVPQFRSTGEFVVLNLDNLNVEVVSLSK